MAGCNASLLLLGEGVEHAVVRVDRGQPVLGQLVVHHLDNFLHPVFIVCPVTRNLRIGQETTLNRFSCTIQSNSTTRTTHPLHHTKYIQRTCIHMYMCIKPASSVLDCRKHPGNLVLISTPFGTMKSHPIRSPSPCILMPGYCERRQRQG